MKIAGKAYPDPTAFDPEDKHFDPKSDQENPRWYLVDVKFVRKLKRTISLSELKKHDAIAGMVLLRRGNRLSIMPVSKRDWNYILALE
jgi:predicted RNA-binding protein with PUA-like domain